MGKCKEKIVNVPLRKNEKRARQSLSNTFLLEEKMRKEIIQRMEDS